MKALEQFTESDEILKQNAPEVEAFLDIEYSIDIHIGEAVLTVGRILELDEGETIKLDRLASENILLTIEGVPVAQAEVVFTKTGTGARIVEIPR